MIEDLKEAKYGVASNLGVIIAYELAKRLVKSLPVDGCRL